MRPPSLPFPGDAQDATGASSSLGQPPPPGDSHYHHKCGTVRYPVHCVTLASLEKSNAELQL